MAVPQAVSDALATAGEDALYVAGFFLAALIAVLALKFMMRAVVGESRREGLRLFKSPYEWGSAGRFPTGYDEPF